MTMLPMKPSKIQVLRHLLTRGSVFVHLDPRRKHVLAPAKFRFQQQLVLQIGHDMPVPIPDLRIEADGISATLSFKGKPHTCFVPWTSVFGLVGEDGKGLMWEEDLPSELVDKVQGSRSLLSFEGTSVSTSAGASVTDLTAYRRNSNSRRKKKP